MSKGADSPPPDQRSNRRQTLTEAYFGLVAFGALNLPVLSVLNTMTMSPPFRAVAFLGVICALAALAYFGLHRRGFAAGLLGGYALMTLVSGGTCTFLRQPGTFDAGTGLILYVVALVVFGGALLISSLFKPR